MSAIYHNGNTYDEHSAWLASLSADEALIVHSPIGYLYTLVFLSELKRILKSEMPTKYRLRFLEFIDSRSDEWPPEIIAILEPMCDAGAEIMAEAHKLGKKQLDKIAEFEVFSAFAALNPSLLVALRMRENLRGYFPPSSNQRKH